MTRRWHNRSASHSPQLFLVERENRVKPGGSQRWDQARDYGNHNKEQSCSRYAYGVRGTDMVKQRRDQRGRRKGDDEPGGDPRKCSNKPRRMTIRSTPIESAPSAMRMPISRVRWLTE